MKHFRLSDTPIDAAALRDARSTIQPPAPASTFEGWVRNHNDGRAGARGSTTRRMARSPRAKAKRSSTRRARTLRLRAARCVHRIGALAIGELAVWVGVSAAHRDAAFAACRWIIDEVKPRVPIWKNEHYADGESGWLHPDRTQVRVAAPPAAPRHPNHSLPLLPSGPGGDLRAIVARGPTEPP